MGFLDNLSKKIGNAMEKAVTSNLSGASKEEYEKEMAKREAAAAEKAANAVKPVSGSYEKAELNNLSPLLKKIGAIDASDTWIAGFPNYRSGVNATFANIATGKKNLKILAINGSGFYFIKLDDGTISSYKEFRKEDIASVEVKGLLTKSFEVELKDRTVFTVDVTENKDKVDQVKNILK